MANEDPHIATGADAEDLKAMFRDPQVLELTDRDMDALLEAIANPPPPNEAMLRSVERWRKCFAIDGEQHGYE